MKPDETSVCNLGHSSDLFFAATRDVTVAIAPNYAIKATLNNSAISLKFEYDYPLSIPNIVINFSNPCASIHLVNFKSFY